jgi:hypothetical protein
MVSRGLSIYDSKARSKKPEGGVLITIITELCGSDKALEVDSIESRSFLFHSWSNIGYQLLT